MHEYAKLEQALGKMLDEVTEQKLSPGSVDLVHKLLDSIKCIKKIEMMDVDGGYSKRYMRDGGYAYEDGFHDGYSNKRDSMGRYTRHDGRDHIIARVGEMMSVAETEDERKALEKCLRELRG